MKIRTPKALKNTKVINTKVISSVRASMAFEGLKPSMHAQAIGKQYLEDKIDGVEAIAQVKAKHTSRFGR